MTADRTIKKEDRKGRTREDIELRLSKHPRTLTLRHRAKATRNSRNIRRLQTTSVIIRATLVGKFYKQTSGGVMGSPLTVALAEIRTSQLEQHALDTFSDPLHSYRHFVDDGIGAARDADHATAFLNHINSLSSDLQISLPYHPDLANPLKRILNRYNIAVSFSSSSTSIRNTLTRTKSSTPSSSTCNVIYRIPPIGTSFKFCRKCQKIEDRFLPVSAGKIENIANLYLKFCRFLLADFVLCRFYNSAGQNRIGRFGLLCHWGIPCLDCPASYIGQTKRPVLTRITEHERHHRLDNSTDSYGNIKSAPALHALKSSHTIGWNNTEILTTAPSSSHLDLLEHAAITILKPELNRTLKGPAINPQWNSLLPRITSSFRPRPSNISKRATKCARKLLSNLFDLVPLYRCLFC
eukprot:sb/3465222/